MAGRNQNESGLTDKQQLFCFEYLKDFKAGDAYIRAVGSTATRHTKINVNQATIEVLDLLSGSI